MLENSLHSKACAGLLQEKTKRRRNECRPCCSVGSCHNHTVALPRLIHTWMQGKVPGRTASSRPCAMAKCFYPAAKSSRTMEGVIRLSQTSCACRRDLHTFDNQVLFSPKCSLFLSLSQARGQPFHIMGLCHKPGRVRSGMEMRAPKLQTQQSFSSSFEKRPRVGLVRLDSATSLLTQLMSGMLHISRT